MSSYHRFVFNYAVIGTAANGHIFTIDTIIVAAIAYLYKDGTIRTADVESIIDKGGQEITQWVPFLAYNSPANCGDWMKEIEMAAEEMARQIFEEPVKN